METDELSDFSSRVNSREEFILFIQTLKADFIRDKQNWQNVTLHSYLEALEAFVATAKGSSVIFINFAPSWSLFAELLLTASVYE
jgi:hypothetical protein